MADKIQLIKEEIERRIENLKISLNKNCVTEESKLDIRGNITTLYSLLKFIDSFPEEPASEDLEEEYDNYFKKHEMDIVLNPYTNCKDIARHFAEWQKNKDLEDLLKSDMIMPNKFYEKGRRDMREEMMKEAVELHIVESFNPVGTEDKKPHGFTALCYNVKYPDFYPITGQTIKIIPTKKEQQ